MKKYFCASDIHSFYDLWMCALNNRGFEIDNPDHIIIICGDLFDRGDQSTECFEFVKQLMSQNRLIYVLGNHEELLYQCVFELVRGKTFGQHHVSNGTLRTIATLMNVSEYDILCYVVSPEKIQTSMLPILEFIDANCVDYYELGDKVFVHGWIPTSCDQNKVMTISDTWRDGNWSAARWQNGMELAHFKLTIPDKTVVCGHWHTSWGHSRYHKDGEEWNISSANFEPYFDEGIIAIDGCTAYTHKVNVIVFDEEGNIVG